MISLKKRAAGHSAGKILRVNLLTFVLLVLLTTGLALSVSATNEPTDFQPTATTSETTATPANSNGLGLLAAGLVTGLAGIGGGIAVAAGAPAAIAATSEDPKAFGKSLIFVALGESIALYGVVISILILNKI